VLVQRVRSDGMFTKTSAASALFSLYIVLLTLLPSGSVFGVNVKIIVFIPLSIMALQILAGEEEAIWQFAFISAAISVFMMWTIHSLLDPYYAQWAFLQYRDVLTTFAGCLFVRLFTKRETDRRAFVRLCIYTVAGGSFIKILIFLWSLRTGVSVSEIVDRASIFFGVRLMTIELGPLGGRLEFPSDSLLPICVFAVLSLRKNLQIGGLKSFFILGLLLTSTLYTFSRFIWANTVLALCLGILVSRRDKMHLVYLSVAAAVSLYFLDVISALAALRFSDTLVGASDLERTRQIIALKQFFWDAPFFGHGLGSYVLQFVRSNELPYAYEVQALALAGQVGLIGMGLLVFFLLNYYRKAFSFRPGTRAYQTSVFLLLATFLASSFFNPCLLTSLAAVSYGLIFVLASLGSSEVETNLPRPSYATQSLGYVR